MADFLRHLCGNEFSELLKKWRKTKEKQGKPKKREKGGNPTKNKSIYLYISNTYHW